MKEKLLVTIKKENGHKKLWNVVNTLRGKKKHHTIEEKLYDINETELPTEEWTEHIADFWEKIYQ